MARTTKTARKTATHVREVAPQYNARKPPKTAKAAPAKSAWSSALDNAKSAVVNDVTRPVMQSTTKRVGIAAALLGLGASAHALLAR